MRKHNIKPILLILICLIQITQGSETNRNPIYDDLEMVQNPSVQLGDGSKSLSDIDVRLPFQGDGDDQRVYQRLTAINGCYNWRVTHPQLIGLEQIRSKSHPDCANVVLVSSLPARESNTIISMTAKDQNSKKTLEAQIQVSKIERIEIYSRFRQISKGEKTHLSIRAFDKDGNIFSSLKGLKFDWQVITGGQKIRRLPLDQAPLNVQSQYPTQKEKDAWHQGDDFLIRALEEGHASISVQILDTQYSEIKPATIDLTIVIPFVILPKSQDGITMSEPQDGIYLFNEIIRICPTSEFYLELKTTSKSESAGLVLTDIKTPNRKYLWNIPDSQQQMGQIMQSGLFQSHKKIGSVDVIVTDQDIKSNQNQRQIVVAQPFALELSIADVTEVFSSMPPRQFKQDQSFIKQLNAIPQYGKWVLVLGKIYVIKADLFDKEGNQITLTKNVWFQSEIDDAYFEILAENTVGSELLVRVKNNINLQKAAKTVVKTYLDKINNKDPRPYSPRKTIIQDEKEVVITRPVEILHPTELVLLPFIEGDNAGQVYEINAQGGSGTYTIQTEDTKIASVQSLAFVKSNEVGETWVKVMDEQNNNNFDTILLKVTPVSSLTWFQSRVEAKRMGGKAQLYPIALDSTGRQFSNCSFLGENIEYEIGPEFSINQSSNANHWTTIQNYIQGNTKLVQLKNRFEQEPNRKYVQLSQAKDLSEKELFKLTHNNYGICGQLQMTAKLEGATRVKAIFSSIRSEDAEATSFEPLHITSPKYPQFFGDLHSNDQGDQENQTYGTYQASWNNQSLQGRHFVLSHGSQYELNLLGGGNLWQEDSYMVEHTFKKVDKTNADILELSKAKLDSSKTSITVKCRIPSDVQSSYSYLVELTLRGKTTSRYLSPYHHTQELMISCEPPVQQKIHWAQTSIDPNLFELLPKSGITLEQSQRTHFVRSGSSHTLRLVQLDKHGFASLGHQSVLTKFDVSNKSLATISDFKLEESSLVTQYDKRTIAFGKTSGTLIVSTESSAYHGSSMLSSAVAMKPKVSDSMIINIIDDVRIEPLEKTIFFNNDKNQFSFTVVKGSGDFSVSINDTSVASHIHDGRKVRIIPYKTGSISVTVRDRKVPESPAAHTELFISGISRIEWDSLDVLIEKGSHTIMQVTAYDDRGLAFDTEEYKHMGLDLDIESNKRFRDGLIYKALGAYGDDSRTFRLEGVHSDFYNVVATSKQGKVIVSSKFAKVQVFSPLQFLPSTLLLTPNMRYTVKVIDGPSGDSDIVPDFFFEKKDIASIGADQEITGLTVGETVLRCQLRRSGSTEIVTETNLKVRVQLVTSIEIAQSWKRALFKDSLFKQMVVLKFNNETFSQGIAPVSYHWTSSNENVILPHPQFLQENNEMIHGQLPMVSKTVRDNYRRDNYASFMTKFNSSSVYVKAQQTGEANLEVLMAIEYPSKYNSKQNWFKTSTILRVQDELSVEYQEYIGQGARTSIMMLPPKVQSQILAVGSKGRLEIGESREIIKHDDGSEPSYVKGQVLELTGDAGIRTLQKSGRVTLIIQEYNRYHGDQVAMLNIMVRDIFALSLEYFQDQINVPIGSSSQKVLPINYMNENAHLFAKNLEGLELEIELSHPQVVSAQIDSYSQKITLRPLSPGECNIVVRLKNDPKTFDVFKIMIDRLVEPSAPAYLHIGSEVNFMIPKNKVQALTQGSKGFDWQSANSSVLEVVSHQGQGMKAKAKHVGSSDIILNGQIVSTVNVVKVESAKVHSDITDLSFDIARGKQTKKIRLRLDPNDISPIYTFEGKELIRQNVDVSCVSDSPHIRAIGAKTTDYYYCELTYIGPKYVKDDMTSIVKIDVHAAGKASGETYSLHVLPFEVELFSKPENIGTQSTYKFSYNNKRRVIKVNSLADIDVEPCPEVQIESKMRSIYKPNQFEVSVRVLERIDKSFSCDLKIKSKSHNLSLKLKYDHEDQELPAGYFDEKIEESSVSSFTQQRKEPLKVVNQEYVVDAPSKHVQKPEQNQKSSSWLSSIIMTAFMIVFALYTFDMLDISRVFQSLSQSLQSCFRVNHSDQTQEFYSAQGDRSSIGFQGVNRCNKTYQSPVQQRQGRHQMFGPSVRSRGSVMSVRSQYDQIDDQNQMYRPNQF